MLPRVSSKTRTLTRFQLKYNSSMKKIFLILMLSFLSIQGLAEPCPDRSEPTKSISADGSYFEYKCSADNNLGLCDAGVENQLLPKPIQDTEELSDAEFSASLFQALSAFRFPLYRSFGSEMAQGEHLKGAGVNPEIKGVADFNGDGIDDLIFDFYESEVPPLILYGSANGKMHQEENVPASAARRHIRNGEVADLNNDGWLDFAGFTTGDPGKRWRAQGYSTDGKHIPRGQADVVLINMQGNGFKELKVPEVRTNDWNHGGSIGDINGDGWQDILPLSEGEQEHTVPLINLDGTAFKLSYEPYSPEVSYYLTPDLDSGDLDGDGFDDIVVSMMPNQDRNPENLARIGSLRVIYGDGDFDFSNNRHLKLGEHWLRQDEYESFKQLMHTVGNVKSQAGSGHAVGRIDVGTTNVEIMDINGDGALDILQGYFISATGLWQTSGFKAYLNNGDCFVDGTDALFPNQKTNRHLSQHKDQRTNYIHNFHKGDVNNDGYSDLILQVDGTSNWREASMLHSPFVFLNDGHFRYLPANRAMVKEWDDFHDDMVPGDFNGDGFVDIASIKRVDGQPEPEVVLYLWITDESKRITEEAVEDELAACKVSELNGAYNAKWFFGNVNDDQEPEFMGSERLALDRCVGEFEGVENFQPAKELRKNLQVSYKTNGQIIISGHIDLWDVGRSYHTVLTGNLNSGEISGIWEEGDLIKLEVTKVGN